MALWTPALLGASVKRWFDAGAGVTHASGAVSSWADQSGTGGANSSADQATTANKPAYSATGWDGTLPAITFDGVNDFLRFDFSATPTAPFFFIAAIKDWSTGANDACLFRDSNATGAVAFRYAGQNGGANWAAYGNPNFIADNGIYTTAACVAEFYFNDTNGFIAETGTNSASSPSSTGNSTASTVNTDLGASVFGGSYAGVTMGECLFFVGTLDTTTRQKLEGYFAWKWGVQARLPGGHPYASAAPTTDTPLAASATAVATATAALSTGIRLAATAGAAATSAAALTTSIRLAAAAQAAAGVTAALTAGSGMAASAQASAAATGTLSTGIRLAASAQAGATAAADITTAIRLAAAAQSLAVAAADLVADASSSMLPAPAPRYAKTRGTGSRIGMPGATINRTGKTHRKNRTATL
ncbi:MAG: hypothetical protein ACEQSH_00530 [Bacteroidia bacterium]